MAMKPSGTIATINKTRDFLNMVSEMVAKEPAGSWCLERRYPSRYVEMLAVSEELRRNKEETVSMYGFRIRMLVNELVETDRMSRQKVIHLREVQKQNDLLRIAVSKAVLAFEQIASDFRKTFTERDTNEQRRKISADASKTNI